MEGALDPADVHEGPVGVGVNVALDVTASVELVPAVGGTGMLFAAVALVVPFAGGGEGSPRPCPQLTVVDTRLNTSELTPATRVISAGYRVSQLERLVSGAKRKKTLPHFGASGSVPQGRTTATRDVVVTRVPAMIANPAHPTQVPFSDVRAIQRHADRWWRSAHDAVAS